MAEPYAAAGVPPDAPAQVPSAGTPNVVTLTKIVVLVVIIAGLYFGSEVLIPITLAVLLSFVLSPLMNLLRRIWLPRVVAALLAVLIAIGIILALAGVIGTQIAGLVDQAPQYQTTIENKVQSLQRLIATNISSRLSGLTRKIEGAGTAAPAATPAAQPQAQKPVPVVITESPTTSVLSLVERFLTPILNPLATLGIILVVAIFILLQKEDLRDRLIRLFGSSDLHRATAAMDDAGHRLARYFLTQLGINCSFGAIIGIGLYLIGVPSPVLWGILGALLRFVPYIGSYIAAALPIVLAAAVGTGWSMALYTAALYVVVEMTMGQAVEPMVYGHSTGLSPFSVIVAAIFWTWVWGPIGLILSTPLTLCLVVLGRHVEQLEFLDVLLGDRPALTPVENFYQRILAGDPDEAEEHAVRFLGDHSLSAYYDEVALPGLRIAAADARRGVLSPSQLHRIRAALLELIHDVADHDDTDKPVQASEASVAGKTLDQKGLSPAPAPQGGAPAAEQRAPGWQVETPVLCVAARGLLDEAAAEMLVQLLDKHEIGARVASREAVSRGQIGALDAREAAMVCILYVDMAGSPANLRPLVRRLRHRCPNATMLAGLWPEDDPVLRDQAARRQMGADIYVTSLRDAVNACLAAARGAEPAAAPPPRLQVVAGSAPA
ncbi:MAG: AI-2E family transporter [Acetobacteraceae bacterium]|nr:AI-2E family transporter [Acetobacteraceae bacterium]